MTDMYVPQRPKDTIVEINGGRVRIEYKDGHVGYLDFDEAMDLCRALVHSIIDYSVKGTDKSLVEKCELL